MNGQKVQITIFEKHQISCVTTGLFKENSYIVEDLQSGSKLLVDPGDDIELLESELEKGAGSVDGILLTHGHFDHVASVGHFCRKYSLVCWIHESDVKLLRRAPLYSIRFCKKNMDPPRPFQIFTDGAVLTFQNTKVTVVPTPGHTQGSVCLDFGDFVFTGDTLFYKHIGPTGYPESDVNQLNQSVGSLLDRLDAGKTLFPGHGRAWVVGAAREWWRQSVGHAPQYQINFSG